MPFGGLLSLAGPLASIGGALGGLFGGGTPASTVPMPQTYNYQNTGGADNSAYAGIGGLGQYNVAAGLIPQYQQIAQQSVNNPYAQGFQQNANTTGQAGFNSGANLAGSALGQLPNVNALMTLGFDPQQALYSQAQNQNQQQNLAMLNNSGVGSTPYGQGVADKSNTDFNINWQNQQLQRALQGSQGAGQLLGSIGGATNTGLGQMQAGGQMPYNTFQGINANALNTLGQTGAFGSSASTIPQQQIQDYLAYLSGATGQQGANTSTGQLGLNQANSSFQQSQQLGSNLGTGLSGLAKGWGNSGFGQQQGGPATTINYGGQSWPAYG